MTDEERWDNYGRERDAAFARDGFESCTIYLEDPQAEEDET